MKRRDFITLLGAAAAWPLTAGAQQGDRMRHIGVLMAYEQNDREGQTFVAAFWEGLRKLGWMESRNIRIDYRWATPGDAKSLQQFAKELVRLQPDLILSNNTPTTLALLEQTQTVPIILAIVADPLGSRFVTSFARPGGHVTGFTNMEPRMAGKWPELLKEIAPRTSRVAMFFNPATASYAEVYLDPFKAAAASLGLEPIVAPVRDLPELDTLLGAQAREPNGGTRQILQHRTRVWLYRARWWWLRCFRACP